MSDTGRPGGEAPDEPRIPLPRPAVEDSALPLPSAAHAPMPPTLSHHTLRSLLGAWALAACSPHETEAVEEHLVDCGPCTDEALRLRDAVGLLHPAESLDLAPGLRARVLAACLGHRPPHIPVPGWAAPYDTETARLDALLQDIADPDWHAPVRLNWYGSKGPASHRTTVAGVIAHLLSVDGLVAVALGLEDPLGAGTAAGLGPAERTERYWQASRPPPTRAVRTPWRAQTHSLVRAASFTVKAPHQDADAKTAGGGGVPETGGTAADRHTVHEPLVSYGDFTLPLSDALLERAFECWIHADDIAHAVDYPYEPPAAAHLHGMVDLAARLLPAALAERRHGRTGSTRPADGGGRAVRLEIEGAGGGRWLIALDRSADSPHGVFDLRLRQRREVARIALDGVEFCRLVAGRLAPAEVAMGLSGDRAAIEEVLSAAASLSRI